MIRRSLVVVGLIAALVATAAPAGAQQYPPAANFLAVSDTTLFPGQTFTITTGTYLSGATVTITLFSDPTTLGSAVANAVGVASMQATIPTDTPLGTHVIQASGESASGPLTQSVTVTVVPAAQAGAGAAVSGALPRTGSSGTIPLTRVAAVLIAAGGALVFGARRRRHRDRETADVS